MGYQINSDPYSNPIPERIFRPVNGNGPVDDVTLIDLQCGGYTAGGIVGSKPAKLTAGPVAAGTDVEIRWTLWPDTHMGPVITYLAACPGNDCTTFEPNTDAVWFKIQEAGRVGTTNEWASTPLTKPGAAVTYTIPECLAPGAYLVRHEILALHTAFAYPGAQFYPSCHQIEVTGSGASTGPATKVAFPGAYKPEDPGITYDAIKATEYIIPGPELFVCGGSTGATTPSTPYTPAGNDTQPPVYNGSPPTTPTTPATPSTPAGNDTQPPVYNDAWGVPSRGCLSIAVDGGRLKKQRKEEKEEEEKGEEEGEEKKKKKKKSPYPARQYVNTILATVKRRSSRADSEDDYRSPWGRGRKRGRGGGICW
ncbi:glycosyl hydrolase family 61 [Diplocarpon rosae]|nr:glycosyl hydrolase family 61 [Diplocarpon rosae]